MPANLGNIGTFENNTELSFFKQQVLKKYGPIYETIFDLYTQGYKNPEIAKKLNLKLSYVGTAKNRIRTYLKSKLVA